MSLRTMRCHHKQQRMIIICSRSDQEDGTGHHGLNNTCLPRHLVTKVCPGRNMIKSFLKHIGKDIIVLARLSINIRGLMGCGLRRVARIAKISSRGGASGLELSLLPSEESPRRYAIKSVKQIDRRTIMETLSTSDLMNSLLPRGSFYQEGQAEVNTGKVGTAPRLVLIRLTPQETLSVFDTIRTRKPDVCRLHTHLREKDFNLIGERARGLVVRAYAAGGIVLGEGVVIELPHEGVAGTDASFNVCVKDEMSSKGEAKSGEVRADYVIKRGKQAGTYMIEEVRPHPCKERPGKCTQMDVG